MGASTGIGRSLAIYYASDNTILGLGARRVELLEELKEECELRNCETFIYENDVNIVCLFNIIFYKKFIFKEILVENF